MSILSRMMIAALFAAPCLSMPAKAQSLGSIEEYYDVSGDVAAGRIECGYDVDMKRLQALAKPFQIAAGADEATVNAAADAVAAGMNAAISRLRDEGADSACPRMLALYGPKGSRAAGLLSPRSAR